MLIVSMLMKLLFYYNTETPSLDYASKISSLNLVEITKTSMISKCTSNKIEFT